MSGRDAVIMIARGEVMAVRPARPAVRRRSTVNRSVASGCRAGATSRSGLGCGRCELTTCFFSLVRLLRRLF